MLYLPFATFWFVGPFMVTTFGEEGLALAMHGFNDALAKMLRLC